MGSTKRLWNARSVLSSAAVFAVVVTLSLLGTIFVLGVIPPNTPDALGIMSALLAMGLPVPIGVLASARFAPQPVGIHRSVKVDSVTRRDVGLTLATAVGAILVTPFGGWVAGVFFLAYFVTAAGVLAVLSIRAGAPAFSSRISVMLAAAVVLSAVFLGFLFLPLSDVAMRYTK